MRARVLSAAISLKQKAREFSHTFPQTTTYSLVLTQAGVHMYNATIQPFQCWGYFHPKHKDTKIFENPVMLKFIG